MKIVLNMIVKNEEKVIGRCLESVMPLVDAAVIFDTGSEDGTKSIVREMCAGKPLFLFKAGRDFQWPYGEFDFGTARTEAARAAKHMVRSGEIGSWAPDETYLLFLDADMVLVHEGFEKSMLREPHYRLVQKNGKLFYQNTRLARLDFDWICCEPTHEYWAPSPDSAPPSDELTALWIDDRDDGGSKGDKYDRDVRLLKKRLEEDPKNVRAMYYLAQTYYYMALKYFDMRVDAGGWEGERWYAELMRGRTLEGIGRVEDAVESFLSTANAHGHRAEPVAALARIFREQGKNRLAYGFARMALDRDDAPKGSDDLFVDRSSYWTAKREISISAYYVGAKEEGRQACEEILRQPGLSYEEYEMAVRNLLFYLPVEYDAIVRRGRFEVPREERVFFRSISEPEDPVEYLSSSPSIVEHAGGYLVNIRLVNYDHERGRWFVARHKDGKIRTENVLVYGWYPGADQEAVTMKLSDARIYEDWPKGRILGLEDVRLCSGGGDIWFTATTCQVPGAGDKSQVVIGSLDWLYRDSADVEFDVVCPLHYSKSREYEKNWLPWMLPDGLRLIYSHEPFVLLKPTPKGKKCDVIEHGNNVCYSCEIVVEETLSFCRMARYRGGAGPIELPDGRWLSLIHEVAHRENDNVYLHRFIEIDGKSMLPVRVSEAFTFHHHGVEYAAGMARHGANVIVTYGAEERESHWCEIDPNRIKWMPPATPR